MECVLCHGEVTLLDLDAEGYAGLPAHEHCATAVRRHLADALDRAARAQEAERAARRERRLHAA